MGRQDDTGDGGGEAGSGATGGTLHFVADLERFEGTDRVLADVEGREVAVFDLDGEFFALANYCVHQGGPLCEGTVSGALTTNDDFELVARLGVRRPHGRAPGRDRLPDADLRRPRPGREGVRRVLRPDGAGR